MARPTVIGIDAAGQDATAVSLMLRTVIEGAEPYRSVGVVGAYETYDGAEWLRDCDVLAELGRLDAHLANAAEKNLPFLLLESVGACDRARGACDVLCALGASGEGTVTGRGRALSFSRTSPRADVGATREAARFGFVQFRAHAPSWSGNVVLPLVGLRAVDAALAAITVIELLGRNDATTAERLCHVRTPGHLELLVSPEQQVCALLEESGAHAGRKRALEAARREFPGFSIITPVAGAVDRAVRRAYLRSGKTLLVLLGHSARHGADAFQRAVREHSGFRP